MRTKITIELDIEAPDSTGFMNDIRILLENIEFRLQECTPGINDDLYEKWHTTSPSTISGTVSVSPIYDSKGTYKFIPILEPDTTIDEHNKWYVSVDNITRMKALGYWIAHPYVNEYWPMSFTGKQLLTVPCRSDMEAWHWCMIDYKEKHKDNVD